MKFLTSGKVKDVYELEDNLLLFKFSNRISAYDVKFKDEIPKKGEVLCKFAEYWQSGAWMRIRMCAGMPMCI